MIRRQQRRGSVNGMMAKKGKRSRQIKTFLLFGTFLTFILILLVSTVGRQQFGSSHKLVLELTGPVHRVTTWTISYFDSLVQDYKALWRVREENKRLLAELSEAKAVNNQYREAVATNLRLRKLLQFKESLPPPTLTARIVGHDPSLWFRTVIIDRGSSDGIQKGMPAVTIEGIVGQILDTSPDYAKVLLATDPNSAIDVLIQRTRVRGILKGKSGSDYQLDYVLKNSDVLEGDPVVTSELGGIFPKGLQVGTVAKVVKDRRGMFQQIEINPSVDFTKLENLIIIMKNNSLAE
jgi:rod shape-determining protein MreC